MKIKKLFILIISIMLLISLFPMILDLIFLARDRDVLCNYNEYKKQNVVIDSLSFNNPDGSDVTRIDGYSKSLDNYKTIIIFGQIKNDEISKKTGMGINGVIKTNIWYRGESKYAYPAKTNDISFPINSFLFARLKLPIIWIVLLLINIFLYKKLNKNEKVSDNY